MINEALFFFSEIAGKVEREKQTAVKNINEHFDRITRVFNKRLASINLFFKDLSLKINLSNEELKLSSQSAVANLKRMIDNLNFNGLEKQRMQFVTEENWEKDIDRLFVFEMTDNPSYSRDWNEEENLFLKHWVTAFFTVQYPLTQ